MPVLELTLLRTPPSTLPNLEAIIKALQDVRTSLAEKVHPTNSQFYVPVLEASSAGDKDGTKPLEVYILGSWPSIPTHLDFLQNDELKEEVLGAQEGLLSWIAGSHYVLPPSPHAGGEGIQGEGIHTLPLNAPILVLAFFDHPTYTSAQDQEGKYTLSKFMRLPASRHAQLTLPLLDDGCGEPEKGGKGRKLVVSGWESVEAYWEWFGGRGEAGLGGKGEGVKVVILRDLEKNV